MLAMVASILLLFDASIAHAQKQPIPYNPIREADAAWRLRVWRVIDVNEKMNLAFKYPKLPLIQIIHEQAKLGELTVYDPTVERADEFVTIMPRGEVVGIGASVDTIMVYCEEMDGFKPVVTQRELQYVDIKKFRLKEDWIFDKETSTMVVRIIGIAPLLEVFDDAGNYRGDMVMYWVYYPDLRPILANAYAFNPHNDAVRMSWDDLFEMRFFSSYIVKESNVHDRRIQDYAVGEHGYLEGEAIKKKIFQMEHNVWRY
jgi:gliding motility associated protien GldN